MNVSFHPAVLAFLRSLKQSDADAASSVYGLIEALERRGYELGMPFAKPVGKGLMELRVLGRPAFRILYGFHRGEAILLLATKKQKPHLDQHDISLARARLREWTTL